MKCSADQYIHALNEYKGVKEGSIDHTKIVVTYNSIKPLPVGYKLKTTDAWCAAFLSAVAWKIGAGSDFPYECSASRMAKKCKPQNEPSLGCLVFYDWDNNGHDDHVGVVTRIDGDTLSVIEGNSNNAVRVRKISKTSKSIRMFGYLRYKPKAVGDAKAAQIEDQALDKIAHDVMAGVYGNGSTRIRNLRKLGYDYTAIQKRVNEIYYGK